MVSIYEVCTSLGAAEQGSGDICPSPLKLGLGDLTPFQKLWVGYHLVRAGFTVTLLVFCHAVSNSFICSHCSWKEQLLVLVVVNLIDKQLIEFDYNLHVNLSVV